MTHQILVVRGAYSKARIETSPSKELLVVFFGLDLSAAVKIGFQDGEESRGGLTKLAVLKRIIQLPTGEPRKHCQKFFDRRKIICRC